jgi:NAD(P)-dependent dehydrogenase (short-subunit alcohol dehydrogenase family)
MKLKKENKLKQNLFSLQDKKILVTGASSGIGAGIAKQTAQQGAQLVLVGRNQVRLELTLSQLKVSDSNHQVISCDLSSLVDLDNLVASLEPLDGLVLNAGAVKLAPIAFINDEVVDNLFEVNVKSSIRLVQRLVKAKKLKKGASIVFISSIATQKTTVGNAVYSATKGAVNALVKSLALEMSSKRIRTNAILPGFIPTGILNQGDVSVEDLEVHQKNYPLGRYGTPEDVAYLAIYLLSEQSNWMTGSLINLDGGFSLK